MGLTHAREEGGKQASNGQSKNTCGSLDYENNLLLLSTPRALPLLGLSHPRGVEWEEAGLDRGTSTCNCASLWQQTPRWQLEPLLQRGRGAELTGDGHVLTAKIRGSWEPSEQHLEEGDREEK